MKVSIIGAGAVGVGICNYLLSLGDCRELVVVDLNRERSEGEQMDFSHVSALSFAKNTRIIAGDYPDIAGSEVVVVTAGAQIKKGQDRLELAAVNAPIAVDIAKKIHRYAPGAVVIVVTNPCDVLSYFIIANTGLTPQQVISAGCVIDSARLMKIIAERVGLDPKNIFGMVWGEHGANSVIPWSAVQVAGQSLDDYCAANGLPLFVGAYFGHLEYGLISSLGGLAFLYLPDTPMAHRMVSLMAAAFGMIASYALGVMSHLVPALMTPVLTFIAILVTMVCRFYRVGVPGSLFFIMAAAIGAYTPGDVMQIPLKVGLLSMGSLLACLIAFFYSLFILSRRAPRPVEPLPPATFDFVIFDSLVIGLAVGLSLAAAQLLQLDNAYWVPVSCLAVIQGMSLRAVWDKQVQRLLGTAIGLGVSWLLLSLPLDAWRIAAVITALAFIVETAVVRHYGFAAIFITPLTLLLAEAGKVGQIDPGVLIKARFIDTLLGCALGLAGGVCLHTPRIREALSRPLRRLFNARPT